MVKLLLELVPTLLVNSNNISSTVPQMGSSESGAYAYLIPNLAGREVVSKTLGSRKYC